MRIAVIGAGALGLAMGGLLARGGHDVDLVDVRPVVQAINGAGVNITGTLELSVLVKAVTAEDMRGEYALALLLVKQAHTRQALEAFVPHLAADGLVCSMQNGVPEEDVAAIVGAERLLGASVGFGATRLSPNTTRITSSKEALSKSALYLGELNGRMSPRLERTAQVLSSIGRCKPVPDIVSIKWSKLMTNCTFSGLSAALNCTFGDVLDSDEALWCAAKIADEVVCLAQAHGIRLATMQGQDYNFFRLSGDKDIPSRFAAFRRVWDKHRALKASMLQDLEDGRATEVDFINGFACGQGARLRIPTPANAAVVSLVKEAEATGTLPNFGENLSRLRLALR